VKTSLSLLSASILTAFSAHASDIIISGVVDGPLTGGVPKAVELYVINDIPDLSLYGVGSANNGGGSDGQEFSFPSQSASAGSYIYVATEVDGFTAFFGSAPDFISDAMAINGDDGVELIENNAVIDTFGDINTDGSGTAWEYLDGWAYRTDGATANAGTFTAENWTYSGVNALDGSTSNNDAANPFPLATFTTDADEDDGSLPPEEPTIELGQCSEAATLISTIQGIGDASPEVGNGHIVEAIVTGLGPNGFFLQEETADSDEDTASSEGIFVNAATEMAVGHVVRLYGDVVENYGMTTLTLNADVTPLDCGASDDVETITINMPFDDSLEPYEGMLAEVVDVTVVSTNNLWRYGEIVVSDSIKRQPSDIAAPLSDAYVAAEAAAEASLLTIEDNSSSSYPDRINYFPTFSYDNPIRIGDTVSASGPLNYSFEVYRINPTDVISVTSSRQANPVVTEGNLSVATFNVLNYFNGEIDANGDVNFAYSANRGADNESQFALQQARIVAAIVDLNADVVGLMEIENDGFEDESAIAALVNAINAELADTEQYYFISTTDGTEIGTDAITVGILYRASVVAPLDDAHVIDMPIQQIDETRVAQMRPSLIQSFTHLESEKTFAVAVNHFKSKGSECAEDLSEQVSAQDAIQGSCNALRVSAAVTLGEALLDETLPERILVLGDMNAYSAEDPIALLTDYTAESRGYTIVTAANTGMDEGAAVEVEGNFGYHNLAEIYDEEGYSYWYYGTEQVGSLDHVLASDTMLADAVDGAHWNINSPEVYQLQYDQALTYYADEDGYAFTGIGPYRSSDHDPFIATFNLLSDASDADEDEEPQDESNNDSGGSMGFIMTLMAAVVALRRRVKK